MELNIESIPCLVPPDKEWHKDIQYYKGDKIEVALDWYEDNDTVDLGVLK